VTRRAALSVLLAGAPYLLLGIASLVKLYYMQSAVQPLDLLALPEFLPLVRTHLGTPATVAAVALLLGWLWLIWKDARRAPSAIPPGRRVLVGLLASVVPLGVPAALLGGDTAADAVTRWSGAPDGQWKDQTKRTGALLSFVSELPSAFIAPPAGYSRASVALAAERYRAARAEPAAGARINLIVYLVESFMDPADLGVRFTREPVPVFRRLRASAPGGHAVVPNEFGGSANTEFAAGSVTHPGWR
jgi:hypothetical protein